jgi:hypothetical protein
MQKLDLPQALDDIRHKIQLIEERLQLVLEGVDLYASLAATEKDPVQRFSYKEQWMKKREEQVLYNEQLHSQKVYLSEFELDLRKQQEMRRQQLEQIKEHKETMLDAAKKAVKHEETPVQYRTILKNIREKFIRDEFVNDDERISLFREMVNTLQKLAR